MLSNNRYLILEWIIENNGIKYRIATPKIVAKFQCRRNTVYETVFNLLKQGFIIKARHPPALEVTQRGKDYYKLHKKLVEFV